MAPTGTLINARTSSWLAVATADADAVATALSSSEAMVEENILIAAAAVRSQSQIQNLRSADRLCNSYRRTGTKAWIAPAALAADIVGQYPSLGLFVEGKEKSRRRSALVMCSRLLMGEGFGCGLLFVGSGCGGVSSNCRCGRVDCCL